MRAVKTRWVGVLAACTLGAAPPGPEATRHFERAPMREAERSAAARVLTYEIVGLGPAGEVVLERTVAGGGSTLVAWRPPSGPASPWGDRRGLAAPRWLEVERREGRWRMQAEEVWLEAALDPALGDRRSLRLSAALSADGPSLPLAAWPVRAEPRLGKAALTPDGRHLLLPLAHAERAGVEVIDLLAVKAALLEQAGLARLGAGALLEARALLERAQEVDPGSANIVYNLACVHARLGEVERAIAELLLALEMDRTGYRRVARADPDLASIIARPEVCAALRTCPKATGR